MFGPQFVLTVSRGPGLGRGGGAGFVNRFSPLPLGNLFLTYVPFRAAYGTSNPPAHSAGITIQCCARVRMCVWAYMGGWMGGGMRSRSHLYFSCFSLVICLYSSENGIGDPDPNISAFS